MAKYVDINAAKEAVRKAECDANWDGHRFDAEFIENALDFVSVADVVPVVHCKDCEHTYESFGRLVCDHGVCKGCTVREDFFCADGERKEKIENESNS